MLKRIKANWFLSTVCGFVFGTYAAIAIAQIVDNQNRVWNGTQTFHAPVTFDDAVTGITLEAIDIQTLTVDLTSTQTGAVTMGSTLSVAGATTQTGDLTTAGQISIADGDAGDPSIVFTDDDDGTGTGMYSRSADEINFSTSGTEALRVTGGNHLRVQDNAAGDPSFAFISETDSGMFRVGANNLGLSVNAALVLDLEDTNAAGAGANLATVSSTLGIFDGSDTAVAVSVEITNANHTGTGNTVNLINTAAITGDAESNLNAILIGALTGTVGSASEEEIALNIGTGWDQAVVIGDGAAIRWEGATADTEELLLQVVDPTADITVQFRDDSAATYNILVTPNADVTVADFMNSLTSNNDAFAAAGNADDVMLVQRFYLPHPMTVISVDITNIDVANASATDNTIAVAFYEDADAGAQIVEVIGASDDGAGNAIGAYSMNIADTTFEPGWYRIGFCAQDASDNDIMTQDIHSDVLLVYGGGTGELVGTGTVCVNGDPPTTTGAITNAADVVPFLLVSN